MAKPSVSESDSRHSMMLIGPIAPPNWGPAVKNRILLDALSDYGVNVIACNTLGWKRRALPFAWKAISQTVRTRRVVLSVSRGGRWVLLPLLCILGIVPPMKIVLLPTGGLFAQEVTSLPPVLRGFYRWCLSRCTLVCPETQRLAEDLRKLGLGNVIALPNFKPNHELGGNGKPAQDLLRIVYVSRVRAEKGIEVLLAALDTIHDIAFRLDIYGILRDDYKDAFEEQLSHRCYARYCGVLESKDLLEHLSDYDMMVFPTLCESEGFPGVLADAALAGLPVIASDIAANAEIVRDGFNGLLAKPGDIPDWAAKLRLLMSDDRLRTTLAANNRALSENYTVDTVIRDTLLGELDRRGFWTRGDSRKARGSIV